MRRKRYSKETTVQTILGKGVGGYTPFDVYLHSDFYKPISVKRGMILVLHHAELYRVNRSPWPSLSHMGA